MKELIKINGTKEVNGMRFHDIEGGFGKDKKAMLVKEIAKIHGRELKTVNQLINNNIIRFKDNVDIIDILNGHSELPLQNLGFSDRDIKISKNIYILSERGYSKLLKIMDDDLAWEKYDELVDGYFNMRKVVRESHNEKLDTANVICRLISDIPDSDKTETMLKLVDRFYPIGGSTNTSVKEEKNDFIVKNELTDELLIQVIKDNYSKLYIRDITHKGVDCIAVYKKVLDNILNDIGISKKELLKFIRNSKYIHYAQVRYGYVSQNHWEYFLNKNLFE